MMRRMLFLLPLGLATSLHAQTLCTANPASCSTTTGTIVLSMTVGRAFQLDIAPTSSTLAAPTTAIYNTGYASSNGPTATIKSNAPWTLAISASTATWSATNTQTEPARTTKPSTDLQWSLASTGPFTGITTSAAAVTTGNATASSSVSIFYRTLYSWALDTPGQYSLQVVFTVTSP